LIFIFSPPMIPFFLVCRFPFVALHRQTDPFERTFLLLSFSPSKTGMAFKLLSWIFFTFLDETAALYTRSTVASSILWPGPPPFQHFSIILPLSRSGFAGPLRPIPPLSPFLHPFCAALLFFRRDFSGDGFFPFFF